MCLCLIHSESFNLSTFKRFPPDKSLPHTPRLYTSSTKLSQTTRAQRASHHFSCRVTHKLASHLIGTNRAKPRVTGMGILVVHQNSAWGSSAEEKNEGLILIINLEEAAHFPPRCSRFILSDISTMGCTAEAEAHSTRMALSRTRRVLCIAPRSRVRLLWQTITTMKKVWTTLPPSHRGAESWFVTTNDTCWQLPKERKTQLNLWFIYRFVLYRAFSL